MKKLIIGNWKMNGSRASAADLISKLQHSSCDIVICPPFTLITNIANNSTFTIGGQDCHAEPCGAHTGDISAEMLKDAGCSYVILGHSERRSNHHEDNALVKKKAIAAIKAGLIPIICIGESSEQRAAGKILNVLTKQLEESVPDEAGQGRAVIAYEPLWAIGTGNIPTMTEIAGAHSAIADWLEHRFQQVSKIIYGGSVKPENATDILAVPHVDGLLVGGCSLKADDFMQIVRVACGS